jgi:hypothetical protein
MADACCVSAGHHPTPSLDPVHVEDGWKVVARRKQWQQIAIQALPPRQSHRPVLVNLVGRCFNCVHHDHVAADCPIATCCLRYYREGALHAYLQAT